MSKNAPAFPGGELPEHPSHPVGLTKREYFAAAALTGMWANKRWDRAAHTVMARLAFKSADAMLTEGESHE